MPGIGGAPEINQSPAQTSLVPFRGRLRFHIPLIGRATREHNLPWLFLSDRQAQLTRQAVNYIVRLAGEQAKLGRVWPQMLRHSCGYYLADRGTDLRTMQDYLGHRDPKHTARVKDAGTETPSVRRRPLPRGASAYESQLPTMHEPASFP